MKSFRKRNHKNSTKKHIPKEQCKHNSRQGLQMWFQHSNTHFGWAVLAKAKGIMDKVKSYKTSLHRLDCALDYAINTTHDPDSRHDLEVLKMDLAPLISAANKVL